MAIRFRTAALTAVVITALASSAALAATKSTPRTLVLRPSHTKFYLNGQAAAGTCAEKPSLTTRMGTDGSEGCGTEGVPLEEVFYQLNGGPTFTDYTTLARDGVPLRIDARHPVTGQIGTESWTGLVGGFGEVEVDLEIAGVTIDGTSIVFGDQQLKAALSPTGHAITNLRFTQRIPRAAAGKTFRSLRVSIDIHGAYVDGGARHYRGDSYAIFPSLVAR